MTGLKCVKNSLVHGTVDSEGAVPKNKETIVRNRMSNVHRKLASRLT